MALKYSHFYTLLRRLFKSGVEGKIIVRLGAQNLVKSIIYSRKLSVFNFSVRYQEKTWTLIDENKKR
jgi:hypothetical protein